MSLYNLLFGMNSHTPILLAVLGLKENDVERLRDVFIGKDGTTIEVYTRTGGGNRDDYPQDAMRHLPTWITSVDDDFDCTYCTDTFCIPPEFVQDVAGLSDILNHGLRAEFVQHLAKTLNREPTEDDKATATYKAEAAALERTEHFMANGHTFVPKNDAAMKTALEFAEKNGGKLRTCWGIFPMVLTVKRDFNPWPNAKSESARLYFNRIEVGYEWKVDEAYWKHCQDRWATEFPMTMANILEAVETHRTKAA